MGHDCHPEVMTFRLALPKLPVAVVLIDAE